MTGGAILHNVVKMTKWDEKVKMQGMWTLTEDLFYIEGTVKAEASIMTYALKKKPVLYMIYAVNKKLASVPTM